MRACKLCSSIFEEDIDICTICGGDTSKDWQGYAIILDHTKSNIAKKLNLSKNGTFALKVK